MTSLLKSSLKTIFALILLLAVLYIADWRMVVSELSKLTITQVLILLGVSFVLIYISALKWSLFLKKLGTPQKVLNLFGLYLVGYTVNLLVPSYVGGDLTRSYLITGNWSESHKTLASVVLERYTGLIAMLLLTSVAVIFADPINYKICFIVWAATLGALILSLLATSPHFISMIKKISLLQKLSSFAEKLQEAIKFGGKDITLWSKAMFLSLLYHSFTIVNVYTCALAIGWLDVSILGLFIVVPIILVIGSLPITPSGLGIQDGAYFYFLQGLGATPAQAGAIMVILRAKTYVLALLGGIVFLFIRSKRQAK